MLKASIGGQDAKKLCFNLSSESPMGSQVHQREVGLATTRRARSRICEGCDSWPIHICVKVMSACMHASNGLSLDPHSLHPAMAEPRDRDEVDSHWSLEEGDDLEGDLEHLADLQALGESLWDNMPDHHKALHANRMHKPCQAEAVASAGEVAAKEILQGGGPNGDWVKGIGESDVRLGVSFF